MLKKLKKALLIFLAICVGFIALILIIPTDDKTADSSKTTLSNIAETTSEFLNSQSEQDASQNKTDKNLRVGGTTTTTTTTTAPTTTTTAPKAPVGGGKATPAKASNIPAYSGKPYAVINNNVPSFSSAELTTKAYEKYSSLDSKGRCGVAIASCGKEIMPAPNEERGSISSIKPTGWIQAKYNGISGGYLWNRCHLIGWQLSAENANAKNLITGTRYMNINGMLPFENMVADYIKETGNHVAYRVTPIYSGNNLVCNGVQIEAYSIEDNGEGIEFNVYCYNVQPGIKIDYATGASSSTDKATTTTTKAKPKTTTTTKAKPKTTTTTKAKPKTTTTTKKPTTTTKKPVVNDDNVSGQVWIPKTGKKYHSHAGCSNMKNPSKVSLSEAKSRGYEKCSKCW